MDAIFTATSKKGNCPTKNRAKKGQMVATYDNLRQ